PELLNGCGHTCRSIGQGQQPSRVLLTTNRAEAPAPLQAPQPTIQVFALLAPLPTDLPVLAQRLDLLIRGGCKRTVSRQVIRQPTEQQYDDQKASQRQ